MATSAYISTEETTNASRTCRLILGPCTDELRDILRYFVPPQTFPHVIKQKACFLPRLSGPQTDLILPRSRTYTGNYDDMDISLLYLLLRNICGITPHLKGWGNDPDPTDHSSSACIETIRLARNRCIHSSVPSLSNTEFSHIWSTVRAAVVNLDNLLINGCKYEREVDFLRYETMDPVRDQHYQEELRKQVEEDLETREMVTNFKRKLKEDAEKVEKKVKRLEEEIECPVPKNIKAQHNLNLKKWEEEDTFYQETHSFSSMMQKVKDQPYVIFVGVPGSGKSATARHIALKLKSENYQILPIKDIRKIEDYCDTNNPQVFVMEDALGVYGLQQSELNIILRYRERIVTPINENSKLLLTCREIVFNEITFHKVFLGKDSNVIKMCNSEHALNDHDKKQILQRYGLDEDLLTPSELASASPMFPLLCKLFSKESKFRHQGSKFFLKPVKCILDELDKMKVLNKLNYVTLILCMMNGDVLSKEILREKENTEFLEMKTVVLESCRVESHTDTFKFMDALSAMEGTYTKKFGAQYSFIHDYLYEICAFHYGQMFLDQILLYMDSCYIANYVVPETVEATTSTADEESFDLCLRLNEGQYPMFAERLYRDIQDLELYDVFMNDSLKHPRVIQAFINVLERKSYTELKSVFLQTQVRGPPNLLSQVRDLIKETRMQTNEETETERQCVLLDEKWHAKTHMHNIRVISWITLYGHYRILEYILKEVKKYDDDVEREVFMDPQISEHPQSESETFHDKIINDITRSSNATKLLLNCRYIEQTRLLVLACYSGDVETVKAILPHMNRNSLDSICLSNAHTPLVIACQGGFTDIVEELINAGADISQQDLQGNAPLVTACQVGNLSVMEKLVSVGVDVNQSDGRGRRPIVAACQGGNLSLVQELVKAKADVNLRNGDGYPSLVPSEDFHEQEMTTGKKGQYLWKFTTKLDKERYTPLVAASKSGNVRLIEELVKAGANVNLQDGEGNTPLVSACRNGHLNVVEELVKAGADVYLCDGNGDTALVLAWKNGNLSLWDFLLTMVSDVLHQDVWSNSILPAALRKDSQSWIQCVMKRKLNCGGLVNFHATALHLAYRIKRLDIVNALLRLESKTSLNLNLFNTLVFLRHAVVKMDSKGDVVVSERYVWQMEGDDFYSLIRMLDSDGLRNLLQAGLDVNQWIQYTNKDRTFNAKPLLHILLNEYGPCNIDREGKVRILLQAGADANVRVGFRKDDNVFLNRMFECYKCYDRQKDQCCDRLDWEGVSALGRARRVFCDYGYCKNRWLEKRDEYKKIIQEIKKHVRRYSF